MSSTSVLCVCRYFSVQPLKQGRYKTSFGLVHTMATQRNATSDSHVLCVITRLLICNVAESTGDVISCEICSRILILTLFNDVCQ